jgi:hypothetical protein
MGEPEGNRVYGCGQGVVQWLALVNTVLKLTVT